MDRENIGGHRETFFGMVRILEDMGVAVGVSRLSRR